MLFIWFSVVDSNGALLSKRPNVQLVRFVVWKIIFTLPALWKNSCYERFKVFSKFVKIASTFRQQPSVALKSRACGADSWVVLWSLKQRRTRSGHHKEGNLKLRWSAGGDCTPDFRLHIWISILITLQLNSYITFLHLTNHLQSCSHMMMMMISRSVVLAKQMLSSNAGDSLLKSNLAQVKEIQLLEIHIWGRLDLGNWSLPAAQSDGNSEFTINKIPPCSMFTIAVTTMGEGGGWTDSHHHHSPSMTSLLRVEMTIQRSSLCRRSAGSSAPPPSAHLPFSTGLQTTPENKKAGCFCFQGLFGNFSGVVWDFLPHGRPPPPFYENFGPNFFGGCTVKMGMRMRTYPPSAPLEKCRFFFPKAFVSGWKDCTLQHLLTQQHQHWTRSDQFLILSSLASCTLPFSHRAPILWRALIVSKLLLLLRAHWLQQNKRYCPPLLMKLKTVGKYMLSWKSLELTKISLFMCFQCPVFMFMYWIENVSCMV